MINHSLILFSFFYISVSSKSICTGYWKNNNEDPSKQTESYGDGGLGYHSGNVDHLLCPADTLMHNCFFHKSFRRAQLIKNRKWISDDQNCAEYSSFGFLGILKGRKLALIGDSTMMQNFQSFVCNLQPAAINNLYMNWQFYQGGLFDRTVCPSPDGKHCHLNGTSTIEFPYLNVTITYHHHARPKEKILANLINKKYTEVDLVIINFGCIIVTKMSSSTF